MLEREPFQKLTRSKNLMAFKHNGFWQCMDTMRDKNILVKMIKEKKSPMVKVKKKIKILIIGGTGFIGKNLSQNVLILGWNVSALHLKNIIKKIY